MSTISTQELNKIGEYQIVQQIGQGSYGDVFRAVHINNPE